MANIMWPRTSSTPASKNLLLQCQKHGFVTRHIEVGHAQDEGLIALVGTAIEKIGRFGVGARDNDSGHLHDVQLEARGIEALDLLVLRDQHFSALVAALLYPRLLIFNVISRHAYLDEAADQISHVSIAAVSGIGIGNDEGPVVDFRA